MNPKNLLLLTLLLCCPLLASAQQKASLGNLNTELLDSAISQAEGNAALTEEQKTQLLDSYRRTKSYIKSAESYSAYAIEFAEAQKSAAQQAAELKKALELDNASDDHGQLAPDPTLGFDELEQLIQREKAELAALDAKVSDLKGRLEAEDGRPKVLRERLSELKSQQEKLAVEVKTASSSQDASVAAVARDWMMQAQGGALRAETNMLEQELLSQPMRIDLMTVQRERASFDTTKLQQRIKLHEVRAIKLRQAAADAALSDAESAQAMLQGKADIVVKLAGANTKLGAAIAERTAVLEEMKSEEAAASESAQELEDDLHSVQRKLDVLGMSQALGQVLRDQQLRLPARGYSRSQLAAREKLIAASSLRHFEYKDERQRLRTSLTYVNSLLESVPEAEAAALRRDLVQLAKARRALIDRAIDVEATYLRTLGELDFAARRLNNVIAEYQSFISERLLWIRTSEPLSLATFTPLPAELIRLFNPQQWLDLVVVTARGVISNILHPMLLGLGVLLWYARKRLIGELEQTSAQVGNEVYDNFTDSLKALVYTALLAITFPLFMFTWAISLLDYVGDNLLVPAISASLFSLSGYYLGLEFVRCLLLPEGLVKNHFLWSEETVKAVATRLKKLTRIFIPTVLFAVVASRLAQAGSGFAVEQTSNLASLLLVITLVSIAFFYARFPNIIHGQLDHLLQLNQHPKGSMIAMGARYLLVAIPCLLILSILAGFTHTAIEFLVRLLLTSALIALLLLLHEFGVRWLRILRRRMIRRDRVAKLSAALEAKDNPDEPAPVAQEENDPDPEALDTEGRKLIHIILAIAAVFGVYGIWADVLPALGILNTVELWQRTELINGVDKQVAVTLADVGFALLVGLAGYAATQRIPPMIEILMRQRMNLSAGNVYAVGTLLRYAMITVVAMMVLSQLGGRWGQIQWAVAALSVGIGFGLQEIVANFISGLILLFEQPIRVGDTVTVGETSGVVTRIRMRATTIRDWDGRELLVPNKEFITGRLLNWSLSDRQTRFQIVVGVAYGTDLKLAMQTALAAAHEHPDVLEDPAPFITFDNFGDNSLTLVLRCYLGTIEKRLTVASEVRSAVNEKFNEHGICVAFPQRDVHLDTTRPLEVTISKLGGGLPAE